MQDEVFLIDKNLSAEENSTGIKSFIITDNDEEKTNETIETEECECNVSNYSIVID